MSEDVRPFEEYKEMIEDMTKDNMIRGLYDLSKRVTDLLNERQRLKERIEYLERSIARKEDTIEGYIHETVELDEYKQLNKQLKEQMEELKHIMYVIRDDNGFKHLWCKDMILDWLGSD